EFLDRGGERLLRRLLELARGDDRRENLRALALQELMEPLLEVTNHLHPKGVQMAASSGVDGGHLQLDIHGGELVLLQELDQPPPAGELGLRGLVEIRAELRESGEVSVLGQVQTQGAGDLLHGLDLGVAADARDRDADVDGWPDARIEEIR